MYFYYYYFCLSCLKCALLSQNYQYTEGEEAPLWLECDDECLKVMDEDDFNDKLDETDGALMGTPYVLFYHRLDQKQEFS